MASSTTFKNSSKSKDDLLSEILTCGICLSRMTLPCCLPCAHSFCRSCLLDYAENNNLNNSIPMNYIRCPYCKYQLNYRSFQHLESLLIINPTLKQLCELLDGSRTNSSSGNGVCRARCHTCCSLELLKVCKHCCSMLCDTCRRTHLLNVHRQSKLQLDTLDSRLRLVGEKRIQMDKAAREYDHLREKIRTYVDEWVQEIEQQRGRALQILDERQHANEEVFWTSNGFDNGEKLDFFISLAEIGRKKLSAKNITDRDLIELSDNLLTIPDINEETIKSIDFPRLILELEETFPMKQWIRVCDNTSSTTTSEKSKNDDNE